MTAEYIRLTYATRCSVNHCHRKCAGLGICQASYPRRIRRTKVDDAPRDYQEWPTPGSAADRGQPLV